MGKALALILCGGVLYVGLELCCRGRSHWSMGVLGGVCFYFLGLLDEVWPGAPLFVQMTLGAWGIVCAEFLAGLLLNRALGLGVWDYSGMPHDLLGQVCLPFAAVWAGVSGAAVILDDLLRLALFGEAFSLPPLF